MGRTHGNRQTRCHHPVGPEHADRKIGDVHRAALAAIEAAGLAKQLTHHAHHVRAFGQRVAVPAVGGGDEVVGAQMGADPCGHGLLSGGQVQRPAHLGRAVRRLAVGADAALACGLCRILKCPDTHHGAVQAGQCRNVFWYVHMAHCARRMGA